MVERNRHRSRILIAGIIAMYGLYLSASGAQAYSDKMEVLSNNIANVDTPGFKREFAILQARPAEAFIEGTDSLGSGTINNLGGGVNVVDTVTDFSPGAMKATGNQTDFAIVDTDGEAFFVVRGDGQEFLTRSGNFNIDAAGVLRTQDGHAVLSSSHNEIRLDPRYPVHLSEDGRVIQREAGTSLELAIEQPQSLGDLVKVGSSMFSSLSRTSAVAADQRQLKQGFLEHSSSRPVQEMMQLIELTRAYEANIRMIQHQDSTTSSLVNRVLGQA